MFTLSAIGLAALIATGVAFGIALTGLVWARKAQPSRRAGNSLFLAGLLIMTAGGLVMQVAHLLHWSRSPSLAADGTAVVGGFIGIACVLAGYARSRASRPG